MRHLTRQISGFLSLVSCLILGSCDESGSDSASNPPPPSPQQLHIDHPAQSTLGKAYQRAENLQDQIEKQQRETIKQADAIYGNTQSEDESASEPDPDNE